MTISIWVDGDACPKAIKAILFKAAIRSKTPCYFVANHFVPLPPSSFIKRKIVEQGFDKADTFLEENTHAGDIVITGDIPLANSCLTKKSYVLSPRGELFDAETIKQKLVMRDFNETLRGSGIHTGGPAKLSEKNIRQFANHLDSLLAQSKNN